MMSPWKLRCLGRALRYDDDDDDDLSHRHHKYNDDDINDSNDGGGDDYDNNDTMFRGFSGTRSTMVSHLGWVGDSAAVKVLSSSLSSSSSSSSLS